MSKLLKIEAMKLKKSMAFKVMMIIIVAMNLFAAGIYKVLELVVNGLGVGEMEEMAGVAMIMEQMKGYFMFNSIMGISDDVLMLVVIFLCISIGDDFANRTLQNEISAGYSRNSIVISRLISAGVVYVIYSLVYTVTMVLFVTALFEFGTAVTPAVLGDMLLRYVLSVIGNIGFLSIFVLIIFAVKKTGISIGICLASLLVGLSILNILFLNVKALQKVYEWLPFGSMNKLYDRLDVSDIAFESVRIIAVAAITFAIMLFINLKTFKNAELK